MDTLKNRVKKLTVWQRIVLLALVVVLPASALVMASLLSKNGTALAVASSTQNQIQRQVENNQKSIEVRGYSQNVANNDNYFVAEESVEEFASLLNIVRAIAIQNGQIDFVALIDETLLQLQNGARVSQAKEFLLNSEYWQNYAKTSSVLRVKHHISNGKLWDIINHLPGDVGREIRNAGGLSVVVAIVAGAWTEISAMLGAWFPPLIALLVLVGSIAVSCVAQALWQGRGIEIGLKYNVLPYIIVA